MVERLEWERAFLRGIRRGVWSELYERPRR